MWRHKTFCGPYTLPHTVATRASSNFCWITERNWKRRRSPTRPHPCVEPCPKVGLTSSRYC
ncbi:hypothetical protein PsorP6_008478 [Peronosclerospora sorghi]|uniref:Uncharacterized protein n=1 Tax=Peronosclerospora sorghi TaxID=230839 RepID=A0ACC0W8W5_9STRA|nr:hypothetical protein PsorP6_008478 [Peronosclerospora sorghi]